MQILMLGWIAAAAASGLALSVAALVRWPQIGIWILIGFALIAWDFPQLPSLASFGGLSVKTEDVTFVIFVCAAAVGYRKLEKATASIVLFVLLFATFVAAALIVGLGVFGQSAWNEARQTFDLIGALIWVVTQDWSEPRLRKQFRRAICVGGSVLSGIMISHIAIYGLGSADSFVISPSGIEQTARPLVATQALMLLGFGAILILDHTETSVGEAVLGAIFVIAALICQHRSVWVAAAALGIAEFIRSDVATKWRMISIGAFATALAVLVVASGVAASLVADITYGLTSAKTLDAREASWQTLFANSLHSGPGVILFGEPWGFGWLRFQDGQWLTFQPHNWYLTLYLRVGLVGMIGFAAAIAILVARLFAHRDFAARLAVVAALLAYSWTYGFPWFAALLLGWAAQPVVAPFKRLSSDFATQIPIPAISMSESSRKFERIANSAGMKHEQPSQWHH